jgi:hypothetical protein
MAEISFVEAVPRLWLRVKRNAPGREIPLQKLCLAFISDEQSI